MARKYHEENERIKRRYLQYLREAKRMDISTVDKAAEAILRFEQNNNFKPFKRFHIEQAIAFKSRLSNQKNARTGAPLSKATVDGTLRMVKAFIHWLAGQPGYKSRISTRTQTISTSTRKMPELPIRPAKRSIPPQNNAATPLRRCPALHRYSVATRRSLPS